MTFAQFISILKGRWRLAVTMLLSVLLLVAVVSLLLPKQYKATASMLVDVRANPISMVGVESMMIPSFMATQMDIIKSERVARRVVEILKLSEDAELREAWTKESEGRGSFDAWLAEWVSRGLDVKPAKESGVINIGFKASDAAFSAQGANAYVRAYTDTVLDLRVDPAKQYASFFEGRAKQLRDQLDTAQAKLSAYQRQKGIIATDERLDVETARLNELSAQIVMMQALSAESGSRQTAARGASADQMQDVLLNPLISSLKTSLSQQEAKLQELNSRLGDNHPQVIEAKANINALRSRIQAETAKVTSGVSVTAAINRQREAEIRGAYEAQRQRVLRMKEQRDEASAILREVDNAQKAYDAVMVRFNQTALERESSQTNVSLLSPATEPAHPSSPNFLLNGIIAIVLGTIAAIASALMAEGRNRTVRSSADVVQAFGLPIVGVLPRPHQPWIGRSEQPLLVKRVLGQLPKPDSRRA